MRSHLLKWSIAVAYVVLIYATLDLIRIPTQFLRERNLLRLSLALLYGSCFVTTVIIFRKRQLPPWRYAAVTLIFIFGYFTAKSLLRTPEEAIHFFEYGLVGILFARALDHNTKRPMLNFLIAVLIASFCGWIDELLQGISIKRTYDVNDVILNSISSFIGLLVFTLSKKSPPRKFPDKK